MASGSATAQTTNAAGLAEMFNNLPADQQQAILQQVGGGQGGQGGSGASSAAKSRSDSAAAQSNQQNARTKAADAEAMLPHRLRADDLILIEVQIQRQKVSWPTTAGTDSAAAQPLTGLAVGAGGAGRRPERRTGGAPSVAPEVELKPETREVLVKLRDLILSKNPYTLDALGALRLPGFAAITLGGLTEFQASQRLTADPALANLDLKVTYLPVSVSAAPGSSPTVTICLINPSRPLRRWATCRCRPTM